MFFFFASCNLFSFLNSQGTKSGIDGLEAKELDLTVDGILRRFFFLSSIPPFFCFFVPKCRVCEYSKSFFFGHHFYKRFPIFKLRNKVHYFT